MGDHQMDNLEYLEKSPIIPLKTDDLGLPLF